MAGSLLFALVGYRGSVLAEYSLLPASNFASVGHKVLERIEQEKYEKNELNGVKTVFRADKYTFNHIGRGDVVFLCLADNEINQREIFQFLESLADLFIEKFGNLIERPGFRGTPYRLNAEFAPVIRQRLLSYGSTLHDERLADIQSEVDKVKDVVQESITMALERGDRLNDIDVESEGLLQTSNSFRQNSTRLASQIWWTDKKWQLATFVGVLLIIFFLIIHWAI